MLLKLLCSPLYRKSGCIINSMSYIIIENGYLVRNNKVTQGSLWICDGQIVEIVESEGTDSISDRESDTVAQFNIADASGNCCHIDARGKFVAPGFIDIHVHGGGGYDFMDCTVEAFQKITDIHLQNGTTTIVPTTVSSDIEHILKLIEVYKAAKPLCPSIHGLHLEGPYISPHQKGAHKEKYLHSPNKEETTRLLNAGADVIKRITAAPELDNMDEFTQVMCENGISLSVGHSDADSDIAKEAFENGFSHVTHLYSATPSVRKINQEVKGGVVEAAYLEDYVTVELIADGKHAAKDALKLAVKIKGTDHVALVTDALRPAGTDAVESWLGEKIPENRVIIEDGVAKLPDRSSFAGSIATTGMLLKKGITHYGLSIPDTVKMLTETPARILGLTDRGKLEKGYRADVVIFDTDYQVCGVMLQGELVR